MRDDVTQYQFGDWSDRSIAIEPHPDFVSAMRWVNGDDGVTMTPEIAARVRDSFAAQERYRQKVQETLTRAASKLFELAHARSVRSSILPVTPRDHFVRGYDHGAYRGYCEAGECVADALNAAMRAVQE